MINLDQSDMPQSPCFPHSPTPSEEKIQQRYNNSELESDSKSALNHNNPNKTLGMVKSWMIQNWMGYEHE